MLILLTKDALCCIILPYSFVFRYWKSKAILYSQKLFQYNNRYLLLYTVHDASIQQYTIETKMNCLHTHKWFFITSTFLSVLYLWTHFIPYPFFIYCHFVLFAFKIYKKRNIIVGKSKLKVFCFPENIFLYYCHSRKS